MVEWQSHYFNDLIKFNVPARSLGDIIETSVIFFIFGTIPDRVAYVCKARLAGKKLDRIYLSKLFVKFRNHSYLTSEV